MSGRGWTGREEDSLLFFDALFRLSRISVTKLNDLGSGLLVLFWIEKNYLEGERMLGEGSLE
jgi:hypothetical protein